MRLEGFQALEIRYPPRLNGPIPRSGIHDAGLLVEAEAGHRIEVAEPQGSPVAPHLDVVRRVNRTPQEVLESGERPDSLMRIGVLGRRPPHTNLTVLVTSKNPVASDDNGLHKTAAGLKPRQLPLSPPHADVATVGSGVEKLAGGSEGVHVAFLADKGANEPGVGRVSGVVGEEGEVGPGRLDERGDGVERGPGRETQRGVGASSDIPVGEVAGAGGGGGRSNAAAGGELVLGVDHGVGVEEIGKLRPVRFLALSISHSRFG